MAKTRRSSTDAPKRRRGITRDALLQAAAELFARKGYRATSLEDVADTLGVKKTTIYHYVRSKEVLLVDIYETMLDLIEARLRPISRANLPPDERLRRLIHAYIEIMAEKAAMSTTWTREESNLSKENLLRILRRSRQLEKLFEGVIEEGQAKGQFRPLTPRLVVLAILGMCNFVSYWFRLTDIPVERIASEFALILASGLGNDGAGGSGLWPRAGSVGEALAPALARLETLEDQIAQLKGEIEKAQSRLGDGLTGGKNPPSRGRKG